MNLSFSCAFQEARDRLSQFQIGPGTQPCKVTERLIRLGRWAAYDRPPSVRPRVTGLAKWRSPLCSA